MMKQKFRLHDSALNHSAFPRRFLFPAFAIADLKG